MSVAPQFVHVLDDTTFQAYIAQHALTLKYATGFNDDPESLFGKGVTIDI